MYIKEVKSSFISPCWFRENKIASLVFSVAILGISGYAASLMYKRAFLKKAISFEEVLKGSEELRQSYSLGEIVAQLREISKTKKICLFVGRRPQEALPEEEGKLWVSADNDTFEGIPEGRIHIWKDFNGDLTQLHDLFDEIVIDCAVTKFFFGNFIEKFIPLFKETSERVFVFEAIPAAIGKTLGDKPPSYSFSHLSYPLAWDLEELQKAADCFKQYQINTDPARQEEDYNNFLARERETCLNFDEEDEEENRAAFQHEIFQTRYKPTELSKKEKFYQECIISARNYCFQFFAEVAAYQRPSFYYPTEQTPIGSPHCYIVAKGIK